VSTDEGYWVIYRLPCSCSKVQWLARWHSYDGPTKTIVTNGNLDRLRVKLALNGFVRIDRRLHDDPLIIETWI
jgi:hypothetical protein